MPLPASVTLVPRLLHRIYAALFGYFWLPCNHCGRMTGGHEEPRHGDHMTDIPGKGFICPRCAMSGIGCAAHAERGNFHFGCGCAWPADGTDPWFNPALVEQPWSTVRASTAAD